LREKNHWSNEKIKAAKAITINIRRLTRIKELIEKIQETV